MERNKIGTKPGAGLGSTVAEGGGEITFGAHFNLRGACQRFRERGRGGETPFDNRQQSVGNACSF